MIRGMASLEVAWPPERGGYLIDEYRDIVEAIDVVGMIKDQSTCGALARRMTVVTTPQSLERLPAWRYHRPRIPNPSPPVARPIKMVCAG